MPVSPIFYQNQWPAVTIQTLTANAGADGLVSVPDTSGFYVTQIVKMTNSTPKTESFQVVEVISDTQLYLGTMPNVGDKRYKANAADLSAYTTALSSTIEAAQQNKRLPSPQYVLPSVLMPEPVGALRQMPVNPRGAPMYNKGPLKTLRTSSVMTTSYVGSTALDTQNANTVVVLIDVTRGSATGAFVKFEISEDGSTWYPAEYERNGAATVSGDEAQTVNLQTVHTLNPSTASLTRYTCIVTPDNGAALAAYFRASVLSNGATPTSSLVAIKAYACIL